MIYPSYLKFHYLQCFDVVGLTTRRASGL